MAEPTEAVGAPVVEDKDKENEAPSESEASSEQRGGADEGAADSELTTAKSSADAQSEAAATTAPEASSTSEQTSGMAIPPELLVKHPLQYRWVLWYCKADRNKDWEDCLKEVTTFDTVEDFWALYNHIQLASGLSFGSDYYMFKEGIKPMWEDQANVCGGRWLIMVEKNRRNELLDHYWLELLMAMIGEQFEDHGEKVSGAVVNLRNKGDKISLWTREALEDDVNKRVGQILKQKLGIQEVLKYEIHADSQKKNSSTVKPRLTV